MKSEVKGHSGGDAKSISTLKPYTNASVKVFHRFRTSFVIMAQLQRILILKTQCFVKCYILNCIVAKCEAEKKSFIMPIR